MHAPVVCVGSLFNVKNVLINSSYRQSDKDEAAVWPISQLQGRVYMCFVYTADDWIVATTGA
jgi:hypothetical protein